MIIPNKEITEIEKFYTWIGSDGIARTMVKPNAEIFLKDAKENTAVIETFYNGKKFPLLVDIRNIKSISPEAREHFSLRGRESVVKAYAMILSSSLSRMIGNFFLSFHKPVVPVKLFDHEDKALAWLKGFIQ
jgi:hypothetical protein